MKPFAKVQIKQHRLNCSPSQLQYVFPVQNKLVFCPICQVSPTFQTGDIQKMLVFEHVVKDHNFESAQKYGFNYDLIKAYYVQSLPGNASR